MKAIIPAAGMGKRLVPHTLNRPKVMVPLAGKPMLAIISDKLFEAGFDKISVIVGYKKEAVTEYFSKEYPNRCDFFVQEEMKGLAHAILYGLQDTDESVLIILGDTIIDADMKRFFSSDKNLIGVVPVGDPHRFGIVETADNGKIRSMVEKPDDPPTNLAIAGIYLIQNQRKLKQAIEKLIKDNIRTRGEFQLTDALALMMQKNETFYAEKIDGWYDCGTKDTLLATNTYLLHNGYADNLGVCKNSTVVEPVFIGSGSKIINSTVGPNVSIGANVQVDGSKIANSMLHNDSVCINSDLKDSMVGNRTRVEEQRGAINIGDDEHLK